MKEIVNTPGYYYSLAYILAAFVVTCTNRKRITGPARCAAHLVFIAALYSFMWFTDGVRQVFFLPAMMVSVTLILMYLYICCEFTIPEAGYYCARAFICGEFAASLCWLIYFYTRDTVMQGFGQLWKWLGMAAVYGVIFLALGLIEKRLQDDGTSVRISLRELITVIVITIAVFAVSNMSYLDQNAIFGSPFAGEMFTIRTLVDLSGMAVLYAYHIQTRELQMKFEVDTLQNILEMQYKNYQLSQESIEIVNQKYHDLKHQITLLKAEANSRKSIRYLEEMEQDIRSYEAQNKTGNKVLDAVLTSKSLYCQNKDISLTCVADGTLLDFMAEMDISALFGNMLDNAIESAEKLEDKEKRLIHFSVAQQKGFLRIRVENYTEEDISFRNGMPVTTKKDKHLHGFGMKSIQSTVRKYGGSVTAGVRDNWFEIRVLIPMDGKQAGRQQADDAAGR